MLRVMLSDTALFVSILRSAVRSCHTPAIHVPKPSAGVSVARQACSRQWAALSMYILFCLFSNALRLLSGVPWQSMYTAHPHHLRAGKSLRRTCAASAKVQLRLPCSSSVLRPLWVQAAGAVRPPALEPPHSAASANASPAAVTQGGVASSNLQHTAL